MSKKILINGTTLNGANITPLLIKARFWQHAGEHVTFLGDKNLEQQIRSLSILKDFGFVYLPIRTLPRTRLGFIFGALRQNLISVKIVDDLSGKFDVVYGISSVLDMILVPFFMKKKNKKILWITVFDNTVPLFLGGRMVAGNKVIRVLAWFFYQVSLSLLKSADTVFVIKPELHQVLLARGFTEKQLVLTGNGVEADLIRKAVIREEFRSDALFIGRINEAKGIYDMLKVVEQVKRVYPDFLLAIMGQGDDRTEALFKERIKQLSLQDNVYFLGYRTGQEKFDIIKSARIFLFLSETESVPIAPLEAVCSGLKTIVYDLDAYDMYKNNEVIIFKKNNYEAVAKKVIEIFHSGDFVNPRGRLLLEHFDWEKIAQKEHLRMGI